MKKAITNELTEIITALQHYYVHISLYEMKSLECSKFFTKF